MEPATTLDLTSPKSISLFFHASMWWRIFYGSLRLLLGFVLLKVVGSTFTDVLVSVMSHELVEDPYDAIFQFLYTLFEDHSFTITYFVAGYLLFWGTIDILLSILLLKHKLWAFPVSIGLILVFIGYSMLRLAHTHSLVLAGVIVIDTIILYLIYREYTLLKIGRLPI